MTTQDKVRLGALAQKWRDHYGAMRDIRQALEKEGFILVMNGMTSSSFTCSPLNYTFNKEIKEVLSL